jgi:polysaccharide biosynthesis protein PslH
VADILFLAHRLPYPPDRGDKIRSWHILKALTKIAPVHVAALVDDDKDLRYIDFLKSQVASLTTVRAAGSRIGAIVKALVAGGSASVHACASLELDREIRRLLQTHDITTIFAFSGQMAQFVPYDGKVHRFVMDFVDMDSAKFAAFAGGARDVKAVANRFEAKRLLAFERATAARADVSLFVSEAEASLFRSATGMDGDKVQSLENGIDLERFDPALPRAAVDAPAGPLIVFTGQMDYAPNVEAVAGFAQDVLPLIRETVPDAQFAIVGRSPTAVVNALAQRPGAIVTGEVTDTRDWLAAAAVVVAPLKLARGVQNKVLEAAAMARPVVASSGAAEGIDADLIIADTPGDQAQAVCDLLAEPARARAIGTANRARMIARYSWDAQLARLPMIVAGGVE